jgi:biotin operon repressor
VAGIYTVRNKKTGQTYLGQTVDLGRRYLEWRTATTTRLRLPNHAVEDAFKSSDRYDWEFRVLVECPANELKRMEEKAIARLVADLGPLCLNVPDAGVRKPRAIPQPGYLPLSEVLDEHGAVMSYAQVAERLGITLDSVAKRLARLRKMGRFKFDIKDLPARQQRLPPKTLEL